jgi:hypothetical protein
LKFVASIVLFKEVGGVQLVFRFPGVIGLRVPFPFEEILESFVFPEVAMTSDGFYFVFRFSVDKVRWGSRKVRAVGVRFDVWG